MSMGTLGRRVGLQILALDGGTISVDLELLDLTPITLRLGYACLRSNIRAEIR
jgi:hypothetical protein